MPGIEKTQQFVAVIAPLKTGCVIEIPELLQVPGRKAQVHLAADIVVTVGRDDERRDDGEQATLIGVAADPVQFIDVEARDRGLDAQNQAGVFASQGQQPSRPATDSRMSRISSIYYASPTERP